MNTPYAWQSRTVPTSQAVFDEGLRQHMLRVYNFMGLRPGRDGDRGASWSRLHPSIYQPYLRNAAKVGGDARAAGVSSFFFSFRIHAISAATAQALFWIFPAR